MQEIRITQVTFLTDGVILVTGIPLDDSTKLVVAQAPEDVAYGIAMGLASGIDVTVTPPDEAIVDIRELP